MSKTFNVNGICYPNEHYMVNIDSKLAQIKQLVDEKKYFVINRARQYGKTTTLNMLVKYLADKYTVFFISFEGLGETAFESETAFCGTICELLYDTVLYEEVPTIDDTVKQAVNFAQTSSDNWWREFKTLESGTVNMPVMTYSPDKVNAAINKIKSDIIVEAKDATEKRVSGSFQVSQSQTGYNFDYEKVLNELTQSIKNNDFNKTIKFDITETKPKYESSIFTGADKLIGNYSSQYKGNDENRVQNLRNACSKINGVILYPGEEFSTNAHFNPCTEENGWALAGTIVKGKIEDSVGGGMCQVSSALYDAVLYAELEVTERHNHSMKVGYSPYAFDATLAGDYKDFKFKNNTNKAVYIESYLTSSNVVVNLYGEEIHPAGRTIELENKLIEETDPDEPVEKKDPTLLEGETEVVTPLKGYKYELYKKVYENGVLKETVKINTSTYSPRQQVTYIGTKKAETTTESTETTTKS